MYNHDRKKERCVIMSKIRNLANLILEMRKVAHDDTISGEDVINRNNFEVLSTAIQNLKTSPSGIKAGSKLVMGYQLKKMAKLMKGQYIIEGEMEKSVEV